MKECKTVCENLPLLWDDSYSVPTLDCNPEPESTTTSLEMVLVATEESVTPEPVEDASQEMSNVSCEETELDVPQESEDVGCVIASDTCSRCEEVEEDGAITGLEIVKVEAPEILASDSGVENTEVVWETKDLAKEAVDSAVSLQEHQLPEKLQQTAAESDSIHQQKLHNQPEKLPPTSQAKLGKAMEQPDSPQKKSKSRHRILKAEGLHNVPNSKQAIQKPNNNTQRATHKFPRRRKPQRFDTGSMSLQGCTQNAISFSQGLMRDFHFVAARLTEELNSMRCLLAESNMSESNFDEMKILIRNAEKTEENSNEWISLMERDCNRFCKLMGMVNEDSPATEISVEKKKKIKFADDAGGDLCQVKVFKIDLEIEL